MAREELDGWLEKGILVLVLTVLAFAPLATGAVRDFDFLVVQGLVLAITAAWATRWFLNPQPRLYWPPLCWPALAFLLYAAGRYWTSDVEYVARLELTRVLVYGLFFFAVINNLRQPAHSQIIATMAVVLALLNSFYAIFQYLTGSDHVWQFVRPATYALRGSGTYICPNHLAGYLEMILPMALAHTLSRDAKPMTKVFFGYAAAMILAGIASTISRGGLAATGAMLVLFLFWFLQQRHFRRQALVMLGVVLVISVPLAFAVKSSFSGQKRIGWVALLTDVRFLIWKPAWWMWRDHLWWGVGPDHFDQRYRQYRIPHFDAQTNPVRVHNDYLNTLADWGLVGGALVGSVLVLLFAGMITNWKGIAGTEGQGASQNRHGMLGQSRVLVVGGAFGLVAILGHSLLDFNMHIPANALMALGWMAVVLAQFRLATDKYWTGSSRGLRLGVGLALAMAAVCLGGLGVRRGQEVYWLGRAAAFEPCSVEHLGSLQAAFRAEPANYRTAYALGECYRLMSWEGFGGYETEARLAMDWFRRCNELNRYNANSLARYGMCLDWLGEQEAAGPYFERAHELDPGGYYTTALVGWHWMQKEDYLEAKRWLEKSAELYGLNNVIASYYLREVREKLGEGP